MGINIVDKRNNPKGKSSPNRQKLLKRIGHKIKKAMPDIIKNNGVKDLTSSRINMFYLVLQIFKL